MGKVAAAALIAGELVTGELITTQVILQFQGSVTIRWLARRFQNDANTPSLNASIRELVMLFNQPASW